MSVRLVVTITAAPGKGAALAQVYKQRAAQARTEAGCEQFDVYQGIDHPDRVVLLERWADQAALDAHAQQPSTREAVPEGLRLGAEREDYQYNRTR